MFVPSSLAPHDARIALRDGLAEEGFALIGSVSSGRGLGSWRAEADRLMASASERGGCRHGLRRSALLRELAVSEELIRFPRAVLGPAARPVGLTVFDKTPQANWKVPWHQDLTIAVAERREVPGFGPWSVKDGLPHVQPPTEVLAGILALRLHLDDTGRENGALRVLPGTHRMGRLRARDVRRMAATRAVAHCVVPAGGAMLMSPLVVHASGSCAAPSRRRVLHYLYSAAKLPGGLRWPEGWAPG